MLKKKYKLSWSIYDKHAEALRTTFFTLRLARSELLYSRFGFVVSKRIDKRAIVRNRVKRRASVCIEHMLNRIKPGYDLLFVMKREVVDKTARQLCEVIESILGEKELLQ